MKAARLLKMEIEKFESLAGEKGYQNKELERARHNIAAIGERLKRHDYRIASYADNKFNVPERIRDFFTELEFHSSLGKLWLKVLKGVGLKKGMKILDLCPGAFPKVELGLFYSGFKGEVSILDCSKEALKDAETFLGLFSPEFKVRPIISDAFKYSGPRYDLVVANHMLDDILLGWIAKDTGYELGEIYAQEAKLLEAWSAILGKKEYWKRRVVERVSKMLCKMVSKKGSVILTQYPSYMERTLGLGEISGYMNELLGAVSKALIEVGFADRSKKALRFLREEDWPFGAKHCRVLSGS